MDNVLPHSARLPGWGRALAWFLVLSTAPIASQADAQIGPSQADMEGDLLHRVLDLSDVRVWSRQKNTWQPLELPPARVYVLNLWSVHCEPCKKEFPQLRRIAQGWRDQPDVQFLFLADPPDQTTQAACVAYWQAAADSVPDADPLRSTTPALRLLLENDRQPITLLLDRQLAVRQAFVGAIESRKLGTAIERLLAVTSRESPAPKRPGPPRSLRR
jgi:thiol-disulfide isomerase/thioredoxin